jgi:hypothetical protein
MQDENICDVFHARVVRESIGRVVLAAASANDNRWTGPFSRVNTCQRENNNDPQ